MCLVLIHLEDVLLLHSTNTSVKSEKKEPRLLSESAVLLFYKMF